MPVIIRLLLTLLLALQPLLLSPVCAAAPGVIRYIPGARGDSGAQYFFQLLTESLKITEPEYPHLRLMPVEQMIHQERALRLLDQRVIDVFWTTTSREREEVALPVRIPLMAGLFGQRVLLISGANRQAFADIHNPSQLAQLMAISGNDWPDTEIMSENGLKVMREGDHLSMFRMLSQGIVDYFPRGVMEAPQELERFGRFNLVADEHLLLSYPAAIYFFVSRDNPQLAARLELGLQRLLASGRFDDLLFGSAHHQQGLTLLLMPGRRVLQLDNPLAPESFQQIDKSLWFSAERYQRWQQRKVAAPN